MDYASKMGRISSSSASLDATEDKRNSAKKLLASAYRTCYNDANSYVPVQYSTDKAVVLEGEVFSQCSADTFTLTRDEYTRYKRQVLTLRSNLPSNFLKSAESYFSDLQQENGHFLIASPTMQTKITHIRKAAKERMEQERTRLEKEEITQRSACTDLGKGGKSFTHSLYDSYGCRL